MTVEAFPDFQRRYKKKNIGLREAVHECVETVCSSHPKLKDIEDKEDRYRAFFRMAENGSGRSELLLGSREAAKESDYYSTLVENWGKNPPSNDYRSRGDRKKAIEVFYYLKFFHEHPNSLGELKFDPQYGEYIESKLDFSGQLLKKRKLEAEGRKLNEPTPQYDSLDNSGLERRALPKRDVGNNTSLKLEAEVVQLSEETRFLYRSRSIPFIGDPEVMDSLSRFLEDKRPFVWHVIFGPGGTGKSRLALEFALLQKSQPDEEIGFLSNQQLREFDWQNWKPGKRTTLIVDYAARNADVLSDLIQILVHHTDPQTPVRLLLLERDLRVSWFELMTLPGSAIAPLIENCWFEESGELMPPDDLWPIFEHICADEPDRLPDRELALAELARIDQHERPLFAAFLADAYRRGDDPRSWDAHALVNSVLAHERRYWNRENLSTLHENLCACATVSAGIPANWLTDLSSHEFKNYWPEWFGNKTMDELSVIYGQGLVDDIPPLEPDILGEAFAIEYWRTASRFEREKFSMFAGFMAPWFAEFLDRAVSDFPSQLSFDLLKHALSLNFKELENAKSELVYNLVTYFAPRDTEIALSIFWLFRDFEKKPDNYAECVVDAAQNLLIGSTNLAFEQSLEIYKFQAGITAQHPDVVDIQCSTCGVAASLLAKHPELSASEVKFAMIDAFKIHRRFPKNPYVANEFCLCLANFVFKLPEDEYPRALRYLARFEKIVEIVPEDSIESIRHEILFHVFLQGIAHATETENLVQKARISYYSMQKKTNIDEIDLKTMYGRLIREMQNSSDEK